MAAVQRVPRGAILRRRRPRHPGDSTLRHRLRGDPERKRGARGVARGGKAELLGGPFIYTLVLLAVTAVWWRNAKGAGSPRCRDERRGRIGGYRRAATRKGNAAPVERGQERGGERGVLPRWARILHGIRGAVSSTHHVDVGAPDAGGANGDGPRRRVAPWRRSRRRGSWTTTSRCRRSRSRWEAPCFGEEK